MQALGTGGGGGGGAHAGADQLSDPELYVVRVETTDAVSQSASSQHRLNKVKPSFFLVLVERAYIINLSLRDSLWVAFPASLSEAMTITYVRVMLSALTRASASIRFCIFHHVKPSCNTIVVRLSRCRHSLRRRCPCLPQWQRRCRWYSATRRQNGRRHTDNAQRSTYSKTGWEVTLEIRSHTQTCTASISRHNMNTS